MKKVVLTIMLMIVTSVSFVYGQSKPKGSYATIKQVNGDKVIDCNISLVTDTIDLKLSDIVENCEMIQLETNQESLFKSIYHIGISDNFIAIHSRGKMPIKLFDRKGKFVRNIGSIGKGPGEFNSLYGIQLDESARKIYLHPFARATKILAYSLDNEILAAIPLLHQQTKFQAYVKDDKVTVLSMPFNVPGAESNPIAYQQTVGGELIKEFTAPKHLLVNPRNEKGQFVGFNSEISSFHNSGAFDVYTFTWGNEGYDTLYHYNTEANRLIPQYVASFNGKKHGSWSYEWNSHYWTLVFGDKYKGNKVVVNKKTLKSDFFHVKNDYYGGIEMKKMYLSNNGMFIAGISPLNLISEFDKVLSDGKLSTKQAAKIKAIKATLDENDNEIIFIGKMK